MTFFLQMRGEESFSYYSGNRNKIIEYPLISNYIVAGILLLINLKRPFFVLFLSKIKTLIRKWGLVILLFYPLVHSCMSKQEKLEDFFDNPENLLLQKRKIGTWGLELRYLIPAPNALNNESNLAFSFTIKQLESKSSLRIIDSSFDQKMMNSFSIVTTKDTIFPIKAFRDYNAPANEWEYRLNFENANYILFLFGDKSFTDSLIKFDLNYKAIREVGQLVK